MPYCKNTLSARDAPLTRPRGFVIAAVSFAAITMLAACNLYDEPPAVADAPVILILVDALRPDHMGVYGFERDTTPALDDFRNDAVLFTNAFAAAPKTVPSVPQLLTSSYFPDALAASSLMELARTAGYEKTAAIINNPYASKWAGRQNPSFANVVGEKLIADEITDRGLTWLDLASTSRVLLYLHYLDTHTPYRPPERHSIRFLDPTYAGPIGREFGDVVGAWSGKYRGVDRQRITDLYDASIRHVDEQLGRLFDGLRERGLYENALIIVTSDHGEEFWDHGGFFHGQSLYDELLRVPLLVKFPDAWRAAATVETVVSTVDLLPTIAHAIRADANAAWAGSSLASLAAGSDSPSRRDVFATVGRIDDRRPPRHAVIDKRFKLIVNVSDGSEELYDRNADPYELENRTDAETATADRLRARLAEYTEPLWKDGYYLTISNSGNNAQTYQISLRTTSLLPFANPDRRDVEPGDTLTVATNASGLDLAGVVSAGDTDRLRFDLLGKSGEIVINATLDGISWPMDRLFAGTSAASADGVLRAPLENHLLESALADVAGETAALSVRRTARAAGTLPPRMSEDEIERLEALGYLN
jgi:arylsulfatase